MITDKTFLHHCIDCGAKHGEPHHHNCASFERDWPEDRADTLGQNGNDGLHYAEHSDGESALSQALRETNKQARYQDAKGDDWIDEFARTATAEEFRGAMRFTLGKYNRRAGKKDELISEIRKMRDYCDRWLAYEEGD